jgi:hypothetical protein
VMSDDGTSETQDQERSAFFGPRGRHRRPRPRKVLLAAGGLAMAAGVLSLVRMTPEPGGVAGLGTTETGPAPAPGTETDRAANTAATVPALPKVSPSATSAMGGPATTRPAPWTPVPPTTARPTSPSPATPAANNAESPTRPATHPTPTPTTATPQPAPGSTSPAPKPGQPDDNGGLCVPIISVCVDLSMPGS